MSRELAILERQFPVSFTDGKWINRTQLDTVRVMVRAEGYAMVRLKGCVPFVVSEKQLRKTPKAGDSAQRERQDATLVSNDAAT